MVSPLFGAGFYYKAFMGPNLFGENWAWTRVYEPLIRRAAGLGAPPNEPDPDRYQRTFDHCDVLVVGGGPAALAAALAASQSGARVVVCDENPAFGGSLLAEGEAEIGGKSARAWLEDALAVLRSSPNVRLMTRTQAFGYYAQNFLGLNERLAEADLTANPDLPRERLWQMRAHEVVLATGAIERPLVFPDNDRPAVMLANSARRYCLQYGVSVGERVVVATTHDSAYRAALDLKKAGVGVAQIVDLRPEAESPLANAARAAGIEIIAGAAILGVQGRLRVKAVRVRHMGEDRTVACDTLLMSGGWTPSVHLFSQSRGKLVFDEALQLFKPEASAQRERSVGSCYATFDLAGALAEGDAAGRAAVTAARFTAPEARRYAVTNALPGFDAAHIIPPAVHIDRSVKAFVDFQNDVCAKDVSLAVQEGMRSIEHIKRYTTTGMATDQGKLSNMNTLGIAAAELKKPIPKWASPPSDRPIRRSASAHSPAPPAATCSIPSAARLFMSGRPRTALHSRTWAYGSAPGAFRSPTNPCTTPSRASAARRATASACSTARTLGKIEVVGPDAATFLERMYANAFQKLEVGRCRYGLMLNEAGFLMDDGVIARVKPDRFHVTTTTGGAPRVLAHMEDYLQTEFTDLRVWATSTTEQWATIAVQGPRARETIAPLIEGADLAGGATPHMSLRDARVCGVPTRLMRVSFTGELGYEINVPSHFGRPVWEAVWREVQKHGGCAYGTEAMHVMRAEKGYVIVGQETDGTVTLADLGLDGMIGKAKKDFVGKRSLARPDMLVANRKQLVGLLTDNPAIQLEEGGQVTDEASPPIGSSALGHVTSSYVSAALDRPIALALVAAGRSRMGSKLHVPMPGGAVSVTVVNPVFYDKAGARLNG